MSYITLFFSQVAIIGGTLTYTKNNVNGSVLSFIHAALYFTILAIYEFAFRYYSRRGVHWKKAKNTFTMEEFTKRIELGE